MFPTLSNHCVCCPRYLMEQHTASVFIMRCMLIKFLPCWIQVPHFLHLALNLGIRHTWMVTLAGLGLVGQAIQTLICSFKTSCLLFAMLLFLCLPWCCLLICHFPRSMFLYDMLLKMVKDCFPCIDFISFLVVYSSMQ